MGHAPDSSQRREPDAWKAVEDLQDFNQEVGSRTVKGNLDLWAASVKQPQPSPEEIIACSQVLQNLCEGIEQCIQEFIQATGPLNPVDRLLGSMPLLMSLYHYYPELMDNLGWSSGAILGEEARATVDSLKTLIETSLENAQQGVFGSVVLLNLDKMRNLGEAQLRELIPQSGINQLIAQGVWPYGSA